MFLTEVDGTDGTCVYRDPVDVPFLLIPRGRWEFLCSTVCGYFVPSNTLQVSVVLHDTLGPFTPPLSSVLSVYDPSSFAVDI